MPRVASKLYDEAVALWAEVCDDPPPDGLGGADLLALAIERARTAGYERLHSPFLREGALGRPRGIGARPRV